MVRSKNGCISCRRKKKKCDEAQPICTLCSKTNSVCEYPVSHGMFLQKNNKGIPDYQGTKRVKIRDKEPEDSFEDTSSEEHSLNDAYQPHKIVHLNSIAMEKSTLPSYPLGSLSPELLKDGHGLDMNDLVETAPKDVDDPMLIQTNKKSPEYQELYDTFRDFMFLNAASQGPQSPVQMPLGLKDVDIVNHFKSFLDYNTEVLLNEMQEILPQVVSGNSLLSFASVLPKIAGSSTEITSLKDTSSTREFSSTKPQTTNEQIRDEQPDPVVDEIKLNHRDFELFTNFVEEIAGWLDMFDHKKHFTTIFVTLSKKSLPLYYSILAISSRHLDETKKLQKKNDHLTYHLYQRSLYYLVPMVQGNSNIEVVASCIILCVFEMMNPSPLNWRKHLKGGATLLMAANIHGFSDSMEKSLFWCFLRMDICNALINDEPTLIPLRKWGDLSFIEDGDDDDDDLIIAARYKEKFLSFSSQNSDMYSNYIVFLAARTVNLISDGNDFLSKTINSVNFETSFDALYQELLEWYINRPVTMKPIICHSDDEEFPRLLFSNGPGISGNQMYHMVMILMNSNKPRASKKCKSGGIDNVYKNHLSNVWHAKRIVGISLVNKNDHGCLSNALQPVYFAGKVLTSKREHQIILDLLRNIEEITGLNCEWRIKDLETIWKDYF